MDLQPRTSTDLPFHCPTLIALVLTLAIAGCSMGDNSEPTTVERLPGNEFKFEIHEDSGVALDDEAGEADRIAQLEKYLADNGLCPNGYVIKEKFPIVADDDPLGQEHVLVYHGICK